MSKEKDFLKDLADVLEKHEASFEVYLCYFNCNHNLDLEFSVNETSEVNVILSTNAGYTKIDHSFIRELANGKY